MFEQATLAPGPAGMRVWTTFLGGTAQVTLLAGAILIPMIWPEVMPRVPFIETFAPPVPPGPPVRAVSARPRAGTRAVHAVFINPYVAPARIPDHVAMIDDAPAANFVPGAPTGDARGWQHGVPGAWFTSLAENALRVAPPAAPAVAPRKPAAAPVEPQRFRVGGRVQLGRLIRKIDPVYPPLAKATRAFGTVVLEAVVGSDGRVREVKVISGNPLLARAAADAVLQWIYQPSRLNDELIEVVASISVTFTLN